MDLDVRQLPRATGQRDDAIVQLPRAAIQMDDVIVHLPRATIQLARATIQMPDGMRQLDHGVRQKDDGMGQLDDGVRQLDRRGRRTASGIPISRGQGLPLPRSGGGPGRGPLPRYNTFSMSTPTRPTVRVFFQEELEKQWPQAWKAGNLRLYEHFQKEAPDLPDTLEAMEPLFTAVFHGCRAGRQEEAFLEIYRRRIQRGREFFSTKKLGAIGSELSALSGFFLRPWDQPSASLTLEVQAFILNEAGFNLRALGRLAEAVQPMEAGLKIALQEENWANAAIIASHLSELTLALGEVASAVASGSHSVDLADRSSDAFRRTAFRTTLADALHQTGRWAEGAEAFREAEALQAEWEPQSPWLYSVWGYRYCDLLLSRGEPEDGSVADGFAANPEAARRFGEACR